MEVLPSLKAGKHLLLYTQEDCGDLWKGRPQVHPNLSKLTD